MRRPTLRGAYPSREVALKDLFRGGGGIHCITQQEPVGKVPHAEILRWFGVYPSLTAIATLILCVGAQPEFSAEVTRFIGFASGLHDAHNGAAIALLEPAIRNNLIVYPPAEIRARFETGQVYSTDETRVFTRAWQRFATCQ